MFRQYSCSWVNIWCGQADFLLSVLFLFFPVGHGSFLETKTKCVCVQHDSACVQYVCVLCPVSSSAPGFYHSQLCRWPHTARAGFQPPAEPLSKSLSFFCLLSVYLCPTACNTIPTLLYLFIPTSAYISYWVSVTILSVSANCIF